MPKRLFLTDAQKAEIERLYCVELEGVDTIARIMGFDKNTVRSRIGTMGLWRDPNAFKAKWNERREAAKAKASQTAAEAPNPHIEDTDKHWKLCLLHGGFPRAEILKSGTVYVYPDRRAA